MAKKNSTKTATKEALQAAEPRVQAVNGWQGVNFADAAMDWDVDSHGNSQTDLDDAQLLVQNNVRVDDGMALATREREETIYTNVIDGWFLTGVTHLKGRWLYMALENGSGLQTVVAHDVSDADTTSYVEVATIVEVTTSSTGESMGIHPSSKSEKSYHIETYPLDEWQSKTLGECEITHIYSYLNDETPYLIVMAKLGDDDCMMVGEMDETFLAASVRNRCWLPAPAECSGKTDDPKGYGWYVSYLNLYNGWGGYYNPGPIWEEGAIYCIEAVDNTDNIVSNNEFKLGVDDDDAVSNLTFLAIYTNDFGSTALGGYASTNSNMAVADLNTSQFIRIHLTFKPDISDEMKQEIASIQLYVLMNESTTPTFIGMVERPDGGWNHNQVDDDDVTFTDMEGTVTKKISIHGDIEFNWYGSLSDTDQWSDAILAPSDEENTTTGPDARYCRQHDGRIYYWGSQAKPYRLYMGGDAGHELNISQGYGGGYIDIEPGVGTVVNGTQKWKTASGASIVTILTGNENTRQAKRFNLVENNISVDSDSSAKSYMIEEIANTVGCQSNWGSGVWADGLYVVDRYGLMLTSMAMEYNTQIQSQSLSDAVRPIFTDEIGTIVRNARMVYADQVVYIIFGSEGKSLNRLDDVVLVYDIDKKAWWTYTYLPGTDLHHVMNIDYVGRREGIGLVTDYGVDMLPTTGTYTYTQDQYVDFFIETGEILCTPAPRSQWAYVAQVQLWFDWFAGDMDIEIQAVDYYGRQVDIRKHTHTDECVHDLREYIRVNAYVESFRMKITGNGVFRLTHLLTRSYSQGRRFTVTRGWDSLAKYRDAHGGGGQAHCYVKNYANLRQMLLT